MAYIFVADLNNDSYPDVIYNASLHNPNSNYELFHTYIVFNNGDGTFQNPVNYYTGICSHVSYAADLDGDGWKDIITLNYDFYNPPPETCSIHILFNDRTGHFQENPVTGIKEEPLQTPKGFVLHQNYPNSFNPSTTLRFEIPTTAHVVLTVFDVLGRKVALLLNETKMPGVYTTQWDAGGIPSGVYFCRLEAAGLVSMKKIIVLR